MDMMTILNWLGMGFFGGLGFCAVCWVWTRLFGSPF